MVVGASGTGKTTFVNTLCETAVLQHSYQKTPGDTSLTDDGLKIKPVTVEIEEDGVRLALTVVDTPGPFASLTCAIF